MKKIFLTIVFVLISVPAFSFVAKSVNIYGLYGNESGNALISLKYIKVDKKFDEFDVRREIKNLYDKGIYENIDIKLKPTADYIDSGFVDVNFYITKKKRIAKIEVSGYESRKIRKKLGLKVKKYYSASKFKKGFAAVNDYLLQLGYLDEKIDSNIVKDTETVKIYLNINPGRRYVLKSVNYDLSGISRRKVRHYFHFKINKPYKLLLLKKGKEKLDKYFNKKSYMNYLVGYKYSKGAGMITVNVKVRRGNRYKVRQIKFKGLTLFKRRDILKKLPLRAGKVFSRRALKSSLAELYRMYGEKGYILVNIDNDFFLNKKKKEADIVFQFNEGQQIFINNIFITGNETTKDYVIRRELLFRKGDIYNVEKVQNTKQKLYQSGFYKNVSIKQYPTASPNKVDLEVNVNEQRTGTLSFGMGYSTLDKLVGQVEVSKKNFLGRGYKIYIKGEVGKTKLHGEVGFDNPWLWNTPTPFSFYIYDTIRNMEGAYQENRTGFNTSIGRQIKTFNKIKVGIKYEKIGITKIDGAVLPAGVTEGVNTAKSITLSLERDMRNNYYHPSNGYHIYNFNQMTGGILGGDNHFYKTYIDVSIFHPIYWRFIFAARTNVGLIFRLRKKEVPDYERFYLGGAQDIRGYSFRSIHLQNRGGNAQFIQNIEIRFNITAGLYGALFFDAGNVWLDSRHIDLNARPLYYSFGLGIRFDTPMGPLRFDFGWPVEKGMKFNNMNFQFSVGELF